MEPADDNEEVLFWEALERAKGPEREAYLDEVRDRLVDAARDEGIAVQVDSRAKHFYSIYSKWKKGRELGEVFDMLGIRKLKEIHVEPSE